MNHFHGLRHKVRALVSIGISAFIFASGGLASAPAHVNAQTQSVTLFGSLSNFDVMNDLQQETHGFEIELDGINSPFLYTFSGNRYGSATTVPFAGGVYLRWTSKWDPATQTWTASTPIATNFTPTAGHQCTMWAVGYATSGCEHFGVGLPYYTNPTNVIYRWLIADPANPGSLIANGTPVSIPAPVWSVPPPAPNQAPVVVAEVQPPPPPQPQLQFGEAKWVKVYKTEQNREVGLDELVADNPVVPQDAAQAEVTWKLLQHNPHSPNSGVLRNQGGVNAGSRAVVRRYEYYKFTGTYDPIDHKAICADGTCSAPADTEVGGFIGAQNAAANIGVPSVTVVKAGNGTVTDTTGKINCGGACSLLTALNAVITLNANPGGGVFAGWSGACNGTQTSCSVTVTDSMNVTATFKSQFTLSIGRGGQGTVVGTPGGNAGTQINCGNSCSAKFTDGTAVTLTATPAAGLHFVNWTGACSGTAPTCTVTIAKDTQVQANFAK